MENTKALHQAFNHYGDTFEEVLAKMIIVGHVHITPNKVVFAQAVPKRAAPADILSIECRWPEEKCDAWYVHFASGSMADVLATAPRKMSWLGWQRGGGPIQWHKWARINSLSRQF